MDSPLLDVSTPQYEKLDVTPDADVHAVLLRSHQEEAAELNGAPEPVQERTLGDGKSCELVMESDLILREDRTHTHTSTEDTMSSDSRDSLTLTKLLATNNNIVAILN